MNTVAIAVTTEDGKKGSIVTNEAAWDLFLSAAEIGLEDASDGANDTHVDAAWDDLKALRKITGDPTQTPSRADPDLMSAAANLATP